MSLAFPSLSGRVLAWAPLVGALLFLLLALVQPVLWFFGGLAGVVLGAVLLAHQQRSTPDTGALPAPVGT